MKLLKLQIRSFGKFKDYTFLPQEGLNALCEANEFGKTTLIYFIYYMFYGYDAKLLKRYLPWSGEELAGALEFSKEGRTWRIERRRPLRGMEKRTILCLETGEELTLANKEQPGGRFLGLDGETFLRSFCITQGDLIFSHTDGLDVALKNMAATGDENVSFPQAEEYLNKLHTQYMHHGRNRGNLLDQKDALARGREEEQRLRAAVDRRISERQALEGLERDLAQKEREIAALNLRLKAAEGSDALKLLKRLEALKNLPRAEKPAIEKQDLTRLEQAFEGQASAQARLKEAQERAEQCRSALYEADDELRTYGFHAESEKELAALRQKGAPLPLAMIVVGLGINVLGIVAEQWWINVSAVLLMVIGVALMVAKSAKRKEICKRYGVADGEGLAAKWAEYRALQTRRNTLAQSFETARDGEQTAKATAEDAAALLEELRQKYRIFTLQEVRDQQIAWGVYENAASGQSVELQEQALLGGRTRAALEGMAQGAAEQQETADQVRAELRRAEGEREALRTEREGLDPRDLQNLWEGLERQTAENTALAQRIAEGEARLSAIKCSLQWLREANEEMNTHFAPKLCKEAGDYLALLTGGKYRELLMDQEFSIRLSTEEGTFPAEHFSAGTRDAIYFAFRLAAGKMLGEEPLPMVLDDPFTNLDSARRIAAEGLLKAAAEERQILYFTCRE